jgi:hypothetical protein
MKKGGVSFVYVYIWCTWLLDTVNWMLLGALFGYMMIPVGPAALALNYETSRGAMTFRTFPRF